MEEKFLGKATSESMMLMVVLDVALATYCKHKFT